MLRLFPDIFFLCPMILCAEVGASCQTPEKSEGRCVHFSSCRLVLRHYAMYKEHMPPAIMRFLQRVRCKPKREGVSCGDAGQ